MRKLNRLIKKWSYALITTLSQNYAYFATDESFKIAENKRCVKYRTHGIGKNKERPKIAEDDEVLRKDYSGNG